MILRRAGIFAVLAASIVCSLSVGLTPTEAAPASGAQHVVIVGIPGLLWSDVATMPRLDRFAQSAAVGVLTVKTAGPATRCGAGALAVSAGNRTESPATACAYDPTSWPSLVGANRSSTYRATLGALGATLQQHGVITFAGGLDAVPLVANEQGHVDAVHRRIHVDLNNGPPPSTLAGEMVDGLYAVTGTDRPAARRAVDAELAVVLKRSSGATVVVVGLSDEATGHANLHPVLIAGPGWRHVELRGSTGRTPYAQLIDVAPTVLSIFGISPPSSMVGRAMVQTRSAVPSIATYVGDNEHAVRQRPLGHRVFLLIGPAAILLMLLAWWGATAPRRAATWLSRLLAPAPALAFVGNALPWWRWSLWAYAGILLAMCAVVALVTAAVARRSAVAAVMTAPALSLVVLVADQLTGSRLQFSSPLGDNPLEAGRFHGVGNLDFAVIAVSAVIVAALVGSRVGGTRGAAASTAVLLVAIVVDGYPRLGDDLGGVLTLVPASLVVVAGVLQVRLTRGRIVLGAAIAVLVAIGIGLADYSRPPASQTHVGRFVGEVLHGGAGTELHRKFDAMVGSFGLTIGTFVVGVGLIIAVLTRHRIRNAVTSAPGVPTAVSAAIVIGVLGMVLNDSGVTVAAMVMIVGLASIYSSGWYADPAARSGGLVDATAGGANPELAGPT